jgi:ATP-dependent protease ClpP protease subunit
MFTDLCRAVDDCIQKETSLRIYLNSPGGDVNSMIAIIDLINECQDAIELIGYGNLSSAAFNIFFAAKCKKQLLPYTDGMAHLPSSSLRVDARGKVIGDDYMLAGLKSVKDLKNLFFKLFKELSFTPEELKLINDGKDVYFTHKQMLELLYGKRKPNSRGTGKTRGENRRVSIIFETEHDNNEGKEQQA